ncbi:hypothetical protein O181_017455 [Austropuccinia psidii MF-1]|uniref:Uncharacterized protein n=1 Tax=Austropuccinia psidii MF-1 TaxID=1389203 RepID=A0A9Q3C6T0_9BASI|nr:hypothetical protein [Austropuccinia psidii MF-1]
MTYIGTLYSHLPSAVGKHFVYLKVVYPWKSTHYSPNLQSSIVLISRPPPYLLKAVSSISCACLPSVAIILSSHLLHRNQGQPQAKCISMASGTCSVAGTEFVR